MNGAAGFGLGLAIALLAACGPTAEEQAALDAAQRAQDQQKCAGFGFTPQTDAFAACMMNIAHQREAQAAADRRAAADREAAARRASDAARAEKDRADQAAWNARIGNASAPATASQPDMNCKTTSKVTQEGTTTITTSDSFCHN